MNLTKIHKNMFLNTKIKSQSSFQKQGKLSLNELGNSFFYISSGD